MRYEEAAQIDAIKFTQLLKKRFPFLRRDTLQRVEDAICSLIEQRSTNQSQFVRQSCGHTANVD
ncbi:hypothetical protein DESA109040_01390 [Deinococcus saxicola]|uniref:hypothetical protein n=1 Tax=Deinococcus saxicola TaxID=249406 RepID=UPI0039EEFDC0